MAVTRHPPPFRTKFLDQSGLVEANLWQRYIVDIEADVTNAAPNDATYVVLTQNLKLPNRFSLGSLTTGYLFITVSGTVATPSSLATIPATDISGTLGPGSFPAVLPPVDGSALTNLTGANVEHSAVLKSFANTGYVALPDQTVLVDATGGATSILLPVVVVSGDSCTVKKIDVTVNAVTVDGNGANIDGIATQALAAQWNSLTAIWGGTAWFITAVV
jgi:hypothetical protein